MPLTERQPTAASSSGTPTPEHSTPSTNGGTPGLIRGNPSRLRDDGYDGEWGVSIPGRHLPVGSVHEVKVVPHSNPSNVRIARVRVLSNFEYQGQQFSKACYVGADAKSPSGSAPAPAAQPAASASVSTTEIERLLGAILEREDAIVERLDTIVELLIAMRQAQDGAAADAGPEDDDACPF